MPYPQIEVTIKYKYNGKPTEPPIVRSYLDAYNIIKNICNKKQILWTEEMLMLCLNPHGRLLGWYRVATGGTSEITMDIGVIATIALKSVAKSVILAHNHPGGSLTPSKKDIETTQEIMKGLRTVKIDLLDHMIFTDKDWLSMSMNGYMEY